MKLPRIPQINDLPALIELLADHKKHLAHLEELRGLHDLLNKKLQAVENLDAIEGMLSDVQAKVFEAEHLKAEARKKYDEATRMAQEIVDSARKESIKIVNEAQAYFNKSDQKQSECEALHSQLEKQLAELAEEKERLKSETSQMIEQSRIVSNLREELQAKVERVREAAA